jgi:hypothetical protein
MGTQSWLPELRLRHNPEPHTKKFGDGMSVLVVFLKAKYFA